MWVSAYCSFVGGVYVEFDILAIIFPTELNVSTNLHALYMVIS